jgi:hypothetical protein
MLGLVLLLLLFLGILMAAIGVALKILLPAFGVALLFGLAILLNR